MTNGGLSTCSGRWGTASSGGRRISASTRGGGHTLQACVLEARYRATGFGEVGDELVAGEIAALLVALLDHQVEPGESWVAVAGVAHDEQARRRVGDEAAEQCPIG